MKNLLILLIITLSYLGTQAQETKQFQRTYDYYDFWDSNIDEWGLNPQKNALVSIYFNYKDALGYVKILDMSHSPPLFISTVRPIRFIGTNDDDIQAFEGVDNSGDTLKCILNNTNYVFFVMYENGGMRFINTQLFKDYSDEKVPIGLY